MMQKKTYTKKKPKAPTAPRDATYLYNYALWYLGRFAASSGHLAKMLARKWQRVQLPPDQDMINQVINRLIAEKWLQDDIYAQSLTRSLRAKGLGARRIVQTAQSKGVDANLAQQALTNTDAEKTASDDNTNAELTAAKRWAQKKRLGPWRTEERTAKPDTTPEMAQKQKLKDMASLARAGFGHEIIRQVL
jgi:regulatory protein